MRAWCLLKTSQISPCMTGLWPFKIGKIAIIDNLLSDVYQTYTVARYT